MLIPRRFRFSQVLVNPQRILQGSARISEMESVSEAVVRGAERQFHCLLHSAWCEVAIDHAVEMSACPRTNTQRAGINEVSFDATGSPFGVYFYRVEADYCVEPKRMVMVRWLSGSGLNCSGYCGK